MFGKCVNKSIFNKWIHYLKYVCIGKDLIMILLSFAKGKMFNK